MPEIGEFHNVLAGVTAELLGKTQAGSSCCSFPSQEVPGYHLSAHQVSQTYPKSNPPCSWVERTGDKKALESLVLGYMYKPMAQGQ